MSLLAAALVAAGAFNATEPPSYPYDGLWTGRVGKMTVTACFTRGEGSYYYDKYLVPISLRDGDAVGSWTEGYGNGLPRWTLRHEGSDSAVGTWTHGERTLPVKLERAAWTDGDDEWGGACGSKEFLAPRAFEAEFTYENQELGGWRYRQVDWKPPGHLADNFYSSFDFEPTQPGDPLILRTLASDQPSSDPEGALFECLVGAIAAHGVDGFVSKGAEPVFANDHFVSTLTTTGNYCGGAHPNFWQEYRLFDRETGGQLAVSGSWFSADGFTQNDWGDFVITPQLREIVMRHYEHEEEECRLAIGERDYWDVGLVEGGLGFIPSVPHVMNACGGDLHVPWSELEPFLSDEGQLARRKIAP